MNRKKINRDFHGYPLHEAIAEVERIISDVRMQQTQATAEFVTGHGVIQRNILSLLESYKLSDASISMSNSGVIKVTIE